MKQIISVLIIFLTHHNCFCKKYYNHTLYRSIPINDDHLKFLRNISEIFDVNFWREPGSLNKPVDFIISPDDKKEFMRAADASGLYLATIMEDVQKAFDKQTVKPYIRRRTESFDWQNYFRIDDIYTWLKDLSKVYPRYMKLKSIGKTYENRDIMAVTIAFKEYKTKPKVIIEGGIHAREWISPVVVTYLINKIVHALYSSDNMLKELALKYEWHFVPVLNPDGYEYSHDQDRLWRKNRRDGHGIDLNRNFDHGFGSVGVSHNKKSEIYCGDKAFSELETQAMADYVRRNNANLQYYFSFHSYGQFMIIPYSNTKQHLENFAEVNGMAKVAAAKIASRYKTKYTVGTAYDTVGYTTSGVSGCWVKKTFKVPYVVIFELRDTGQHGFALPTDQILPTCQETMDGLFSLLSTMKKTQELIATGGAEGLFLDKIVVICLVLLMIIVLVL